MPLGQRPVRTRLYGGQWTCLRCGKEYIFGQTAASQKTRTSTPALEDYVRARRLQGASKRSLTRETGLSLVQLEPLLKDLLANIPLPPLPKVIGILRWRWRRRMYWVITDPVRGDLIDIVPHSGNESIEQDDEKALAIMGRWLSKYAAAGTQCLVEQSDWAEPLREVVEIALDPMTTSRLVLPALLEVRRHYTDTLPIPTRRTPKYHRHRRIIQTNPAHLTPAEKERLEVLLRESEALRRAYELTQLFRAEYAEATEETWTAAFARWSVRAQKLGREMPNFKESALGNGLIYSFRDAQQRLQVHKPYVLAGLRLRSKGVTLGSSRQLLSKLGNLEAARQPDFELLRYVAKQELKA